MTEIQNQSNSTALSPSRGRTLPPSRLQRAEAFLSQGIYYGLITVILAVGYFLIYAGLGYGLSEAMQPYHPLLSGLVFLLLAMAILSMREGTQSLVNRVFFHGSQAYQERLQTFTGDLTRAAGLPEILNLLYRNVEESLTPEGLFVFLYDAPDGQYTAAPSPNGKPATDLRFAAGSGLAAFLSTHPETLVLDFQAGLPDTFEAERSRLVLLGAQVFVPLPGRQHLAGWLAIGPQRGRSAYTSLELKFVETLCEQAALAVERAQVATHMETRAREMEVLGRVSQGINITLSLDDILELIYAQTVQVIPAQRFHIMLYDREQNLYQYAFCLEDDERIFEKENRPIPPGQALEQEITRHQRPIRVEDFNRECQRLGLSVPPQPVYAWMGVPLNAGAETIGALSLSSTIPGTAYRAEQQALLQAIADQAAGALVKARLLEETQRRTRQLTTLNEVTRQLTSTLETEPLLQLILESAADILNCEAGSLLMIDEQTNELVFRVVIGPVAHNLINHRMPADRGVVGRAVQTRQNIIVNDVTRFPDWFAKTDEDTGFVTRAVLVIPLMIKDHTLGVIEIINKRDGTGFTQDDLELLSAFASQAVVAIENARLYTLTDQALEARVEELSVMQRIDRELNTSLETSTAMRITLEWAMRQSGAAAGFVGILQAGDSAGVRIMASQGYESELDPYENSLLPAAAFQLEDAIAGGQPVCRMLGGSGPFQALLAGGRSQVILPIRRESVAIGLLLLEWTKLASPADETLNFLTRLGDHAAIAISNAQLYAAVQQANLAKSDFVSFVAHELKNPMTSVKGYTELIAAGAVGPITDVQASFLSTIRHNIERMNTLVSDLNDMSKIEVGRLRLDFKSTGLTEILESTIRSTRKQIEEKQQTLNLYVPEDLPNMWADKVRVEQTIVNLISNAHKYTSSGGTIDVFAERCPNQWDSNGAPEVVHIWVKDNGIGISEDDQKKIFQKFFRADDPLTRESPGTGLGLNITRSLVEMQGGRIWFESVFRQGTTFHFTIPVSENE